jgi:signal transduction histidine kinase
MTGAAPAGRRARPSDLASLAERYGSLRALRVAIALIVVSVCALAPSVRRMPLGILALVSVAYAVVLAAPDVTRHLGRDRLLPVVGGTLLLDGLYLAWVAYATGGAGSPLRFLIALHVVAVMLLASYRTGLKVTAWHSILFFVVVYAQAAGLLAVRESVPSSLPGHGQFELVAVLVVGGLWVIALGTAAFSAVGERELRTQRIDLERLSTMIAQIDRRERPQDIPEILLDSACDAFGFGRGLVLVAPAGELSVAAFRGSGDPPVMPAGLDPVMEEAWASGQTRLLRRADPAVDPRLAEMLPDGRNLLVVPLYLDRGSRLGLLVLERAGSRDHIRRWVVTMVEQFAAHAALSLHNAWLLDELERRLEENRALQDELLAQNLVLDSKVRERTRELSDTVDELRRVDEQRRKLLARLIRVEEEERRNVASDIHDGPVQEILVAGLFLHKLQKRLSDAEDRRVVDMVSGAVDRSVKGLRGLLSELRPEVLDTQGLEAGIAQLLGRFEDLEFGIDNRLGADPPSDTRLVLYRISQEVIANVRKHAMATRVDVTLDHDGEGYLARIRDDGVGFQPPEVLQSAPGHLGLSSMRERAEMAGGWCRILGAPGAGTTVEFWLPEPVEADEDDDEPTGTVTRLRHRSSRPVADRTPSGRRTAS